MLAPGSRDRRDRKSGSVKQEGKKGNTNPAPLFPTSSSACAWGSGNYTGFVQAVGREKGVAKDSVFASWGGFDSWQCRLRQDYARTAQSTDYQYSEGGELGSEEGLGGPRPAHLPGAGRKGERVRSLHCPLD